MLYLCFALAEGAAQPAHLGRPGAGCKRRNRSPRASPRGSTARCRPCLRAGPRRNVPRGRHPTQPAPAPHPPLPPPPPAPFVTPAARRAPWRAPPRPWHARGACACVRVRVRVRGRASPPRGPSRRKNRRAELPAVPTTGGLHSPGGRGRGAVCHGAFDRAARRPGSHGPRRAPASQRCGRQHERRVRNGRQLDDVGPLLVWHALHLDPSHVATGVRRDDGQDVVRQPHVAQVHPQRVGAPPARGRATCSPARAPRWGRHPGNTPRYGLGGQRCVGVWGAPCPPRPASPPCLVPSALVHWPCTLTPLLPPLAYHRPRGRRAPVQPRVLCLVLGVAARASRPAADARGRAGTTTHTHTHTHARARGGTHQHGACHGAPRAIAAGRSAGMDWGGGRHARRPDQGAL